MWLRLSKQDYMLFLLGQPSLMFLKGTVICHYDPAKFQVSSHTFHDFHT